MSRVVFVDRDGVINKDPIGDYIKRWEDFEFEEGALEGLKQLTDAGWKIIVISNQAGVGDGVYPESSLWDIHKNMIQALEEKGIKIYASHYCLHGKQAGCGCRKPQVGLFKEAVKNLDYNPREAYFIGDKVSDMQAGKRFGIRTIFVRTGHGREHERQLTEDSRPDFMADNLLEAVKPLLS